MFCVRQKIYLKSLDDFEPSKTVLWLRKSRCCPTLKPEFKPWPVVHKVALGQVFPRVLRSSLPVSRTQRQKSITIFTSKPLLTGGPAQQSSAESRGTFDRRILSHSVPSVRSQVVTQRPGLDQWSLQVRFVVQKVTLGTVLRVFWHLFSVLFHP